jgi:hypothetical protein
MNHVGSFQTNVHELLRKLKRDYAYPVGLSMLAPLCQLARSIHCKLKSILTFEKTNKKRMGKQEWQRKRLPLQPIKQRLKQWTRV